MISKEHHGEYLKHTVQVIPHITDEIKESVYRACDGADIGILRGLKEAVEAEGAMVEFVAPRVGGIVASDGTRVEAAQKVDGGPSVLYDAVAVVISRVSFTMPDCWTN